MGEVPRSGRWSLVLVRAPLIPMAAVTLAVVFAGGSGGERPASFDYRRPASVDVVVPLLGAAAWQRSDDGWAARVRVTAVRQKGRLVAGPERVWLRFGGQRPPPPERRLRVRGYFTRRPSHRNLHLSRPGEWGLGVKSRQLVTGLSRIPSGPQRAVAGFRQRLLAAVDRTARPGAVLARALVFGDARSLPPSWRTGLRRAGLSHLLAVSGLHVGLVLGGFWWLCGGSSSRLVAAGAVAVLVLYGCLVGPKPSLLRAAVMALFMILALAVERPPQALNALCAALIAILCVDPGAAADVGFRLSFLATAGILLLAPRLLVWWRRSGASGRTHPLAAGLAATVAAQVATMPLTAAEMGLLTPWSPLANLLFVPWTALALAVSLAWVVVESVALVPVLAAAAGPVAAGLAALLDILSLPFAALARLPPGTWVAVPVSVGIGAGLCLALWLGLLLSGARRGAYAVALVLVCTPGQPDATPRVTMLDVGQGEAVLLRSGEAGPVILIDGGGFRRGNFAETVLLSALAAEGVHGVDLAILSHGDTDHCGGLLELSHYLRIGALWAAPVEVQDGCGRNLVARLAGRVRLVERGLVARVGAWRLEVLHPGPGPRGGNSASLVVRACAGEACVLLTGDLDLDGERELLAWAGKRGTQLHSDTLKVAHHGSRTSTGEALLAAVKPGLALVSAGRRNSYGHPSPAVVERLEAMGVRVLRTDHHGRIDLRFPKVSTGAGGPRFEVSAWPRLGGATTRSSSW